MAALGVVRQKLEQLRQVPVPPPPDNQNPHVGANTNAPGYHQAMENMMRDAAVLENKVTSPSPLNLD